MKKEIHPENYRPVIFVDTSNEAQFLISSTVPTNETGKWKDGKEYPLYKVEISSASHPFYTGKDTIVDTAGRVEKFKTRAKKAEGTSQRTEGAPKPTGEGAKKETKK